MRRSLAASLIGEIAEVLSAIEAHDIEGLLGDGAGGGSPVPLPIFSEVAYRSQVTRFGLLRSHSARLIAAFYASLTVLGGELHALAGETSESKRAERVKLIMTELPKTMDLGDMALRDLRSYISHHDDSTLRAGVACERWIVASACREQRLRYRRRSKAKDSRH